MKQLHVDDKREFGTIQEIADTFNVKVRHYGYLRPACVGIPAVNNEVARIYWWPREENQNWENRISENEEIIYERPCEHNKRCTVKGYIDKYINEPEKRIVFFKRRREKYKFVGVFELKPEESHTQQRCVWKRIGEVCNLPL